MRLKESGQVTKKQRTQSAKSPRKLSLTPEIQALYFQCLAGKLHSLTHEDQRLIVQIFDRQFPALQREARRFAEKRRASFLQRAVNAVLYVALVILTIAVVLLALEYAARAEVSSEVISAAQEHAEASMRKAWQEGREEEPQPVNTLMQPDGSMTLTQNAPRRMITLPNGEPGLSDRHTTITVIPPPTPVPAAPPQHSRIHTTVNGIDRIETQAVLPEQLAVDQMEALKQIADNGTLIAQQRFGLEQYKLSQEMELEYLRLVKSFVLWGFLASIPFLFTSYWIFKHLFSGYRSLQRDRNEYALKEQELTDKMIYEKK
jgi:hypothetical protein